MYREQQKNNMNLRALRNFREGETLYISRKMSGYIITFYCAFIKIEKGCVVARVLDAIPNWAKYGKPEIVRARAKNCYVYGRGFGDDWTRAHWFAGLDKPEI